jgi:hypothetical protein
MAGETRSADGDFDAINIVLQMLGVQSSHLLFCGAAIVPVSGIGESMAWHCNRMPDALLQCGKALRCAPMGPRKSVERIAWGARRRRFHVGITLTQRWGDRRAGGAPGRG